MTSHITRMYLPVSNPLYVVSIIYGFIVLGYISRELYGFLSAQPKNSMNSSLILLMQGSATYLFDTSIDTDIDSRYF